MLSQAGDQDLTVRQRRNVQLVTPAEEHLDPGRLGPAACEAEVHSYPDAPAARGSPIQPKLAAQA
jgi:hypothetical protein